MVPKSRAATKATTETETMSRVLNVRAAKTETCKFCPGEANHYVGGGQWVCFRCFLRLLGF